MVCIVGMRRVSISLVAPKNWTNWKQKRPTNIIAAHTHAHTHMFSCVWVCNTPTNSSQLESLIIQPQHLQKQRKTNPSPHCPKSRPGDRRCAARNCNRVNLNVYPLTLDALTMRLVNTLPFAVWHKTTKHYINLYIFVYYVYVFIINRQLSLGQFPALANGTLFFAVYCQWLGKNNDQQLLCHWARWRWRCPVCCCCVFLPLLPIDFERVKLVETTTTATTATATTTGA